MFLLDGIRKNFCGIWNYVRKYVLYKGDFRCYVGNGLGSGHDGIRGNSESSMLGEWGQCINWGIDSGLQWGGEGGYI